MIYSWAYMCSLLRVHSNVNMRPMYPFFLIIYVQYTKKPSHQKVAFISVYICSIPRVHSTLSLCPMYPFFLSLHVQYTKNQMFKKWLQFELIFAAYLKYIVISNYVRSTHFSWPYKFSTLRTQPSKSGFQLILYV